MKRLFFALWPSGTTRKAVDNFNQTLKAIGLKIVKADNLHVTLVFLGNVDGQTERLIKRKVSRICAESFMLNFNQLTLWHKPRILCLLSQAVDPRLLGLVSALRQIAKQCAIKVEDRPYQPHITLARKAQEFINVNDLNFKWCVHSFCLVDSCRMAERKLE